MGLVTAFSVSSCPAWSEYVKKLMEMYEEERSESLDLRPSSCHLALQSAEKTLSAHSHPSNM